MSIQALAWVLECSQSQGSDRLVLMAIANHTDGRGYNAYPSVDLISVEARVSRSTVFRCLDSLEAIGELEILRRPGRKRGNIYRVRMERSQTETFSWDQDDSEKVSETVSPEPEKVSSAQKKGVTGATQNRNEPSKAFAGACETDDDGAQAVRWIGGRPLTDDEKAAGRANIAALRRARGYCQGDE